MTSKKLPVFLMLLILFQRATTQTQIDTNFIWKNLRILANDSLMGRRPGTPGEQKTLTYLSGMFQEIGLTPANKNTFLQPVELVHGSSSGSIVLKNGVNNLSIPEASFLIRTEIAGNKSWTDADLAFVGYGITAPEFNWDDYKSAAIEGKIVVVVDMEPEYFSTSSTFTTGQKANSFHSTPSVKVQNAKLHGAAGIILLTDTKAISSNLKQWRQLNFTASGDKNLNNKELYILCSQAASETFARANGMTMDSIKKMANHLGSTHIFTAKADISVQTKTTAFTSYNVVGFVEGSDPILKKEYLVYSTHWDGYGIGVPVNGDSIFNAAKDNAGGISELLGIARAFCQLSIHARRSIVFIASTGEESGLLGAKAYVQSPLFPLNKTVMMMGMDIFSPWGKPNAVGNENYGYTSVDTTILRLAKERGLPFVRPPGKSSFASSDQYPFARAGVPAVFASIGSDSYYLSEKKIDSLEKATMVHTPFDEIRPEWNLQSAGLEAGLMFDLGLTVANNLKVPQWKVCR